MALDNLELDAALSGPSSLFVHSYSCNRRPRIDALSKKNQLFLPFFNHILNIIRSETSHEPFILILLTSRRFNNIVTRLRIFSHLWELGDLRFHKTYIIWEDIKKYFKRSISVITFSG